MRSAVDSHAAPPPLLLALDRTDGRRGGGQLHHSIADEILADCLDQLDKSGIDQNADAEWESGRRAKMVNDQVMMRRALERRANQRGRVKGVKTFAHDDYDRFNYDGPFVHHFTREVSRTLAGRANHTLLELSNGQLLTERRFIIERRETVKAATLRALNRTTLPRPPDLRAKCYLSGAGADDIRPALFRALPC